MLSRCALIVDDERDIRDLVALALSRMGLRVETAADLASARAQLVRQDFDLCITDMRLPDGSGLSLVEEIAARHPRTAVAMMTAYGNVEAAVAALKAGAFDFVTKPVDLAVLRQLVTHALNLQVQKRAAEATGPKLVGDSAALQQLRERIAKVARSQAPVHLCGEPGTGKELVARLIHAQGPRKDGPFVAVDCGALPPDRLEAELFGQAGGGPTPAADGLFQAADGGTLFLDAVADLPAHVQVKLLRVLQDKAVRPIGGTAAVPVDVRVLSASAHDLAKRVEAGRFRPDLYYRINVVTVPVPALRDRPEDLPPLAEAVLARLAGDGPAPRLSDEALAALRAYPFPGNVRELETVLERALALADGPVIGAADLDLPTGAPSPGRPGGGEPPEGGEADAPLPAMADALARAKAAGALPQALEQIEREAIVQALDAHRWNRTRTAAALGITFRALRYKLKKLGIE